jgi:hypothetical protein
MSFMRFFTFLLFSHFISFLLLNEVSSTSMRSTFMTIPHASILGVYYSILISHKANTRHIVPHTSIGNDTENGDFNILHLSKCF